MKIGKDAVVAYLAPSSSEQKFIYFSYPGQEAKVRILHDEDQRLSMAYHNAFDKATNKPLANAVCAKELDPKAKCLYCKMAQTNRDFQAKETLFIPMYVAQIKVAFDKDKKPLKDLEVLTMVNDAGQRVPYEGLRCLMLKKFGSDLHLWEELRKLTNDPDFGPLTGYDILLEQTGSGGSKVLSARAKEKDIKKMSPAMRESIPANAEAFAKMVLAAAPPQYVEEVSVEETIDDNDNPF